MIYSPVVKVLQVSSALESSFGGPPKVVINAHEFLRNQGIDAKLLVVGQNINSFNSGSDTMNLLDNNVYLFPSHKSGLHGKILTMRETVKFFKLIKECDCVLTHQVYNFQNIYLLLISKMLAKPYILMPHGTLTNYQRKQHRIRKLFVDNFVFHKIVSESAAIAVATEIEKYQLDEDSLAKSSCIGIGINEVGILCHTAPKKFALNFIFVGRLAEVKRVDLTIQAFSRFLQEFPNSNLRVAGDGDEPTVKQLKALVNELGIHGNVYFMGWLNEEEKQDLFLNSNFIILNSEKENFAISVAEAQSYGLAALVTRTVAFSEIIEKYKSGVVVEDMKVESIYEGLTRLIQLDYSEISKNALAAAASTSWQQVIPRWISLIERVVLSEPATTAI